MRIVALYNQTLVGIQLHNSDTPLLTFYVLMYVQQLQYRGYSTGYINGWDEYGESLSSACVEIEVLSITEEI